MSSFIAFSSHLPKARHIRQFWKMSTSILPQRQRIAGNAAVVEGGRRGNAVQKACGKGVAENNVPQRQRIAGNAAVAASLRAGKRTKMDSAHTMIQERTDTRKLSGSGRGRVGFQNGRKHITVPFWTDHQGLTKTRSAGTERREPQDEPARSPPAHRQTAAKSTTQRTTDARRHKKSPRRNNLRGL